MTHVWNHKPLPKSTPLPWIERRYGVCAFPFDGEDGGTLSCCLPVLGERSYCKAHCAIVFARVPSRREERPYVPKTGLR